MACQQMKDHGVNLSTDFPGQLAIFVNRHIPGPADFPRFEVGSTRFALQSFKFLAALVRYHGPALLLVQFHATRVLRYYQPPAPKKLRLWSAREFESQTKNGNHDIPLPLLRIHSDFLLDGGEDLLDR